MKAIDLFSGCGGMSLGFEQEGFQIISAFDNWQPAVDIYRANFDHPIYNLDLSTEEARSKISSCQPDIVIGGPPCQDYSIAGKRQIGRRANLTIRFAELVATAKPTWVVFENVYNIERFPTLPTLKDILHRNGYGLTTQILNASYCGVPQKRRRFFLIGRLEETDSFLNDQLKMNQSSKPMTVRDYLGDRLETEHYYMHPRSYARRAVFSVDEPAATIRGINRPIPKNYKPHRGDTANISEGVRALSTRERACLQTFPETFKLPGAKTNVELAIGNAVPPELARFIARAINDYEINH